jgi:hypothetical protein
MAGEPDGCRLGLAVLLRSGVVSWMQAWPSLPSSTPASIPAERATPFGGQAGEVVAVLSAMALACVGE